MIIQCDFDGTIIKNNLGIMLREKFAHDNWRKIESDYLKGRFTVEQSNKLQYALIKEPEEILQQFIRQHIEVRPGFPEFVKYCQDKDIHFVIVSGGLDFYIETVLAFIGITDLPLYCGQTTFSENGLVVAYTDPEGNTIDSGFKSNHLIWLKKRGRKVIYVGDGLSDLEPARLADHVFATGKLTTLLKSESITCDLFTDFHDLRHQIHLLS